jgi:hypothetical protein
MKTGYPAILVTAAAGIGAGFCQPLPGLGAR